MGCVASTESGTDEQRLVSDAIDRELALVRPKKEFRMFLLGAGESGKSTVLKQMRLVHEQLFTDYERRQYADVIWFDLVELMKSLIRHARRLKIALDCDQPGLALAEAKRTVVRAKGPHDYDPAEYSVLDLFQMPLAAQDAEKGADYSRAQVAAAVAALWARDAGIRRCYERLNEFQLELLAEYYFEHVRQFAEPGYRCSDRDIIMGRIKTTGITETSFSVKRMDFKVLDAGGQRLERKKWIHCFRDIDLVIFVLAVLEYDQCLYEDGRTNRMQELLALFEALCNLRWFQNTSFILFLNKVDLLDAKLRRLPIQLYFPDYERDPHSVDQVLAYFETKLLAMNRLARPIYVHRTCATDTLTMRFVLLAVTDTIVQTNLKRSGIM